MRLAGIEKGGYYPYPPNMAEAMASWFISLPAGTRGRLLDPCAGEGEIASLLGTLLNCETWGCELFPNRAEKAVARMDKCHSAAWANQRNPFDCHALPGGKGHHIGEKIRWVKVSGV